MTSTVVVAQVENVLLVNWQNIPWIWIQSFYPQSLSHPRQVVVIISVSSVGVSFSPHVSRASSHPVCRLLCCSECGGESGGLVWRDHCCTMQWRRRTTRGRHFHQVEIRKWRFSAENWQISCRTLDPFWSISFHQHVVEYGLKMMYTWILPIVSWLFSSLWQSISTI